MQMTTGNYDNDESQSGGEGSRNTLHPPLPHRKKDFIVFIQNGGSMAARVNGQLGVTAYKIRTGVYRHRPLPVELLMYPGWMGACREQRVSHSGEKN